MRTSALTIVEILNDGDPVPANFVDKLFEPFVKGSNPGQPDTLGLGLFVSRDLARRMGGALSYSYDGDRVMFSLSLPGARPATVAPPAPVVPSEEPGRLVRAIRRCPGRWRPEKAPTCGH